MRQANFKFSLDILRRLGEELVPNIDPAIIELVKNAYDADAIHCTVELVDTDRIGGTLQIADDGIGMDEEALITGWLTLGRSPKSENRNLRTALGRLSVGEKGLGRLSALRAGQQAIISTRPKSEPGVEYTLNINWQQFDNVQAVEDVVLSIHSQATTKGHGTDIQICSLQTTIDKIQATQVARSLLLLADPFENECGFHPLLISPAFVELEERVQNSYFDESEYKLVATLNAGGTASAKVLDWKGAPLFSIEQLGTNPYRAASAIFELWVYLLDGEKFIGRDITLKEVRGWLQAVGGVHIYERGVRVRPYGDAGNDWLNMNLARARSPERRPSTNTSIGKITILDTNSHLIQKTDRTGYIENETFSELERFATDALEWMARERLHARDKHQEKERREAPEEVNLARQILNETLSQVVTALPEETRQPVEQAIEKLEQAREREAKVLRKDVQLYRTLATVGTTAAVFAHETGKPISMIMAASEEIEALAAMNNSLFLNEELLAMIGAIKRAAQSLQSFSELSVRLLQASKRRAGRVDAHAVLDELLQLFRPFLKAHQVEVNLDLSPEAPRLLGSVAALEAICANLLTNALYAVVYGKGEVQPRRILIRTRSCEDKFHIHFLDNGPGIIGISIRDIWLPGHTTKPNGIGLGLTIVRDSAIDLGGSVNAVAHGEAGGAEFIIELPCIGAKI